MRPPSLTKPRRRAAGLTGRLELLQGTLERILQVLRSPGALRKPLAIQRALTVLGRQLLRRGPVLWFANLSITNECNLQCQHCFASLFRENAQAKHKKELTTAEYVAAIREMYEAGVVCFEFQGGEVFLRADFPELVRACRPERSFISIVSNGILLTEERIRELKALGVDQLNISLDSGIPEEHDALRGRPGTWARAFQAVELGLRHGFKVFVTTTVTHQSLYSPGFTAIRELCERKGVVLWLLIGIPVGSWSGQLDVLIDEKDHAFMEQLNRRSRNLIRRDLSARFLNPRPDERELERIYPATYPCHATQQRALTVEIFRRLNLVRLKRRLGELHARRATDPLRILDVGCGDGFHLDLLRELFPRAELSGVEPAAEAARRARARGHTVHARRFEELEALPGSFDLIHAHHVLEHLARPDLFVERALALLGDDGLLLLETPSTDSLDFALLRGGRWGGYHAPRHWFLFSRRSATWMVERTGGQIRASGACTSSCFWTWSCHALTMDLLGRRVADALFPPLRIFEGGPQALLLLSSFAAFERALTAITGRGNGIWLLIGRRPGGSSFEARR